MGAMIAGRFSTTMRSVANCSTFCATAKDGSSNACRSSKYVSRLPRGQIFRTFFLIFEMV